MTVSSFLNRDYTKVPFSQRTMVFQEVAASPESRKELNDEVSKTPSKSLTDFRIESEKVLQQANKKRDELMLGCKLADGVVGGVDMLIDFAKLVSAPARITPIGIAETLALDGAQWVLNKTGKYAVELCEKSADKEFEKIVSAGLKKIKLDDLKTMTPDERRGAVLQTVFSGEGEELLRKADPQARPTLLFHMNRVLESQLKDQLVDFNKLQELRDRQLTNLEQDVSKLKGFPANLDKFYKGISTQIEKTAEGLQTQIDTIHGTLNELNVAVGETQEQLASQAKDLSFVKEFMYGQMSPAEKLHALRAGMVGIPQGSEEYKKEVKKQELVVKQQEFIATSQSILSGANAALTLLSSDFVRETFGISESTLKTISTTIRVGETALNVFANITSGNWVGAATSVFSLFGLGQRDIAGERHQEVMNGIREIQENQAKLFKNQEIMSKQLEAIMDTQKVILESQQKIWDRIGDVINNQKITFDAIVKLGERMSENHQEVMKKLAEIEHLVRYSIHLQKFQLSQDAERAWRVIDERQKMGRSITWRELRGHYQRSKDDYTHSLAALRDFFVRPPEGSLHPVLCLKGSVNDIEADSENHRNPNFRLRTQGYEPLLKLFYEYSERSRDQSLVSLTLPSRTLSSLQVKWEKRSELPIETSGLALIKRHIFEPGSFLDISSIHRYGTFLFELQKYLPFLDGFEMFQTARDFIKSIPGNVQPPNGIRELEMLEHMVSFAIAQQNLLSGDLIIPYLSEVLSDHMQGKPEVKGKVAEITGVLANHDTGRLYNQFLERNLSKWLIKHHLLGNHLSYILAWNIEGDRTYLKEVFPQGWHFRWFEKEDTGKDRGWYLVIQEDEKDLLFLPLPSPASLKAGVLEYAYNFEILIELKRHVVEALLDYQMEKVIPQEQHALLRKMQMESALLRV